MARYMSQYSRSGRLLVFFTAARLEILGHNLSELFADRISAVDRHRVAKLREVPLKPDLVCIEFATGKPSGAGTTHMRSASFLQAP